jgi:hypothetical protein
MDNPFDNLGSGEKIKKDVNYELVEDSRLACQECGFIVTTGRYYDSEEILSWKCPKGHKSVMSVKL